MEKDCQYLSWENAPIGPLLGHAAHLARERMDGAGVTTLFVFM